MSARSRRCDTDNDGPADGPASDPHVLGHSSPTVTKTIYVEATRKVQRDAVDGLGFLFDA